MDGTKVVQEEEAPESSSVQKHASPHRARRSALRSGVKLNVAARSSVENGGDEDDPYMSKTEAEQIRAKHIIKIFQDEDNFIEVSPEQLERVRTMHRKFDDGASFSFNYNILLLVASLLAGLGLVSNSGTNIIASMLVSPIMGPVVGLAYGTTIRDWKLVRKSLITECISLIVCVVAGLIIGASTGPSELSADWPTEEMLSRGTKKNFIVAIPVAFFSGLGVAVSLLDDQTSSLVGVAISASLLPPAVNAGIMWIAFVFAASDIIDPSSCIGDTASAIQRCGGDEMDEGEYFRSGGVSLLLTVANIILIWMFRMKEVLPIKKTVFWEDLGVARKVYTNRAVLSNEHYQMATSKTSVEEEDGEATLG